MGDACWGRVGPVSGLGRPTGVPLGPLPERLDLRRIQLGGPCVRIHPTAPARRTPGDRHHPSAIRALPRLLTARCPHLQPTPAWTGKPDVAIPRAFHRSGIHLPAQPDPCPTLRAIHPIGPLTRIHNDRLAAAAGDLGHWVSVSASKRPLVGRKSFTRTRRFLARSPPWWRGRVSRRDADSWLEAPPGGEEEFHADSQIPGSKPPLVGRKSFTQRRRGTQRRREDRKIGALHRQDSCFIILFTEINCRFLLKGL